MVVSLYAMIVVVLVALVAWLGAKWLFRKDTEVEARRLGAIKLAASLQSYGLKKIPAFLQKYAVGDYSGMAADIKALAEMFASGEAAVIAEFDAVFEKVLAEKLKTESGRALVATKLADAVKPEDPSAVKKAPTVAVAA